MKSRLFLSVILALALFACNSGQDEVIQKSANQGLVIKTGTICGWCTINDTLVIRPGLYKYVNYAQCGNQPVIQKNGELDAEKLSNLLSKFDFGKFKEINLNTCNVCFDGCDEWILYENGADSHYISFSKGDPQLEPIREFIELLNQIKAEASK